MKLSLFPSHAILSGTTMSLLLTYAACAHSSPTGLFAQDIVPNMSVEETCYFSAQEVEYPYYQLHASLFQTHSATPLPPISRTWDVICTAPVNTLLLSINGDTQINSVLGGSAIHFGLGHVNGQGSLGYYEVTLGQAKVDDNVAQLYQTPTANAMGEAKSTLNLTSGLFHGWTQNGHTPASGSRFSVVMTVSPILNSLKETQGPLVEGAELSGEIPLTFSFSI